MVVDLGTLGGDTSSAFSVNRSGQVVGESRTSGGQDHAFLYLPSADYGLHPGMNDLGTLGGVNSQAYDINNFGEVAGRADTVIGIPHAFLYLHKPYPGDGLLAGMNDLGALNSPSNWSLGIGVNDSRWVIGQSLLSGEEERAFVKAPGSVMQDLGTFGGKYSWAMAINNAGQAVGGSHASDNSSHSFLWSNGTITDLGTQGGQASTACDINEMGHIVGNVFPPLQENWAYLLRGNGVELIGLLESSQGEVIGVRLNKLDQVVMTRHLDGGVSHGFLWDNGTLTDLNSLIPADSGWELKQAGDINDAGQIVGTGVHEGLTRGFLLTPAALQVATAKRLPDGTDVDLQGAIVSAVFGDTFYVESDDRSCGIRVEAPGHSLAVGMRANVSGTIMTNPDHERYIQATTAVQNGSGTVSPLGLGNRAIGGVNWHYDAVTGAGQIGVLDGYGLNNIGLFVQTWGSFTITPDCDVYLDDGSGLKDGTLTGEEENIGIRVVLTPEVQVNGGLGVSDLMEVTGISSCFETPSGDTARRILATRIKILAGETYDIDTDGIPKFVGTDYIELAKIEAISKFRSGEGHDYSDDFESCRSMKHYSRPRSGVDWSAIKVLSPVSGTVSRTLEEWAGTQVWIKSDAYPAFRFIIFHVNLSSPLQVGDVVTAGQQIGTHIGTQTQSDIAVGVSTPGGWKLVSYFQVMTDSLFAAYQGRGMSSRDDAIISKEARDADPLVCNGEQFASPGNLENRVTLN